MRNRMRHHASKSTSASGRMSTPTIVRGTSRRIEVSGWRELQPSGSPAKTYPRLSQRLAGLRIGA
jgi:hypothetical protein